MSSSNSTTNVAAETLQPSTNFSGMRRRMFYASQAAEPRILKQAPRITRGEHEHLFVQFHDITDPVRRVSRVPGTDLMTVTTDTAVFLMTHDEYARSIPDEEEHDERDASDVASWADGLMCALISMKHMRQFMSPAALTLWQAGTEIVEGGRDQQARLGYALALDAIIASPGLLDQAARDLRQALVDTDPDLAMLLDSRRGARLDGGQPIPLAVDYAINGEDFRLEPDGTMLGFGRELSHREVFNLLTFFRMPGVAALIDRLEIEHQTEVELQWQAEQAREMTAEQAYELVMGDPVLRNRIREQLVDSALEVLKERIGPSAA